MERLRRKEEIDGEEESIEEKGDEEGRTGNEGIKKKAGRRGDNGKGEISIKKGGMKWVRRRRLEVTKERRERRKEEWIDQIIRRG